MAEEYEARECDSTESAFAMNSVCPLRSLVLPYFVTLPPHPNLQSEI